MKLFRIAFVAMLASLVISPTADAKKEKSDDGATTEASSEDGAAVELPVIEDTGIAAFDDVFGQVREIHETLGRAQTQLSEANDGIATALGLPAGTPLADALAELKEKAAGNLEIAMEGTVPSVKASDAVPEDVTAAIDAVNSSVTNVSATIKDLSALPEQVKALVDKSKALPAQLKDPAIISEIPKSELLSVGKTVKNNVKATVQTPDLVTGVTSELTGFVDAVKNFNSAEGEAAE